MIRGRENYRGDGRLSALTSVKWFVFEERLYSCLLGSSQVSHMINITTT